MSQLCLFYFIKFCMFRQIALKKSLQQKEQPRLPNAFLKSIREGSKLKKTQQKTQKKQQGRASGAFPFREIMKRRQSIDPQPTKQQIQQQLKQWQQ